MGQLATYNWREKLYEEASVRFREQIELAARAWTLGVEALRDLYRAFDGLPKGQLLGGYHSFEQWVIHAEKELKLNYRQIHYYRLIGCRLLDDAGLTTDEIASMGVEKAKVLAAYTRDIGHAPEPEIVGMAQNREITVSQLTNEVRQRTFGNADDHRGSGFEIIEIAGTREWAAEMRRLMKLGRLALGTVPSDAELICMLIGDTIDQLIESEKHRRSEISGLPAKDLAINLEGEELPDEPTETDGGDRSGDRQGV